MSEKDILNQIRESSEKIEIPESLSPDAVKRRLQSTEEGEKKQNLGIERKLKYFKVKHIASVAAVVVCILGVSGLFRLFYLKGDENRNITEIADEEIAGNGNVLAAGEDNTGNEIKIEKKKDAGEFYVVADNYEEVYEIIEKSISQYEDYGSMMGDESSDIADKELMYAPVEEAARESLGTMENIHSQKSETMMDASSRESHSETNVQTKGVDESDIVKTDGAYIYTVSGQKIIITDIKTGPMKKIAEITAESGNASEKILELYVDGDTLNVIVEKEDTNLNQKESLEPGAKTKTVDQEAGNSIQTQEDVVVCDVFYIESNMLTEVRTYDISNRKKPALKGTVMQEGSYKTSRKIGDMIYLFTDQNLDMPRLERSEAVLEENAGGWIPLVNGKAIAADCIYLPKQGNLGLVISSIDVNTPDQVVDNTLIINNYVDIYVSTDAVYLYEQDYSRNTASTNIAKFSLKEGRMDAVGAVSAPGSVYDTFAMNEYQGKLRLLTTVWDGNVGENSNNLYLFDENLTMTGKLTGMAEGEEIYAARYLGDMVYFVTYRNMDPLFAVDLADEKNPKILGELKVTGFSEYLHFWGENKLLGIGYETDLKTGNRKGIKLTMFDISNPADLKELGSCVLKNADYSPALYNYKAVLADEAENLAGFATEGYGTNNTTTYLLYSWTDGKFVNLLTENLDKAQLIEHHRGVYNGSTFYLVSSSGISSYDRENGYRFIEKIKFEK